MKEDVVAKSEQLYEVDKYLVGELNLSRASSAVRFEALVEAETGETLALRGRQRLADGEVWLELLYKNKYTVRRYHSHYGHRNPGGSPVDGPHKHHPTPESPLDCKFAYQVDDIPVEGDFNEQIYAFLKECNIRVLPSVGLQGVIV